MNALAGWYYTIHNAIFPRLQYLDGLGPLALRLYLVPVLWMAGTQKIACMDNTIEWFGNAEWGLGLPFPALMAHLAAYTEAIGALLLLLGLATRWVSVPLMITMVVAAVTVHMQHGWQAVHDLKSPWASENAAEASGPSAMRAGSPGTIRAMRNIRTARPTKTRNSDNARWKM